MRYAYRLVNVFTVDGDNLSGNPLCVFEDGRGLSPAVMQALALQFNLSETAFILPSTQSSAAVRIFTPAMELPFAGHPTLGSAFVVSALTGGGAAVSLSMPAGIIAVTRDGAVWTLEAAQPSARGLDDGEIGPLAEALGIDRADIAAPVRWISTGMEQLMVPLRSTDAVRRARPGATLERFRNAFGKVGVCVFSPLSEAQPRVRFFFGKNAGAIAEDPATGSACANLGGHVVLGGAALPFSRALSQGAQIGRPSRLLLDVTSTGVIRVGGEVIELGRGHVELPNAEP